MCVLQTGLTAFTEIRVRDRVSLTRLYLIIKSSRSELLLLYLLMLAYEHMVLWGANQIETFNETVININPSCLKMSNAKAFPHIKEELLQAPCILRN